MVGDEMGEKVVAVQFRAAEVLTGATLRKVFSRILALIGKLHYHTTSNKINIHHLAGTGSQTQGVEVTKDEMHGFDHYAKKYHVWYSLTREKNDKQQYVFMFKLKDIDRLNNAMRDFFKDGRDHTSLKEKMEHAREEAFHVNQATAKEKEEARENVKSKGRGRNVER